MRMISTTPPTWKVLGATHSDLAFTGKYVIQGNYNGFEIYDISHPVKPVLVQTLSVPRVAERRIGLQEPAVHVVRSDQQPVGLRFRRRAGSNQQGSRARHPRVRHRGHQASETRRRACRRAADRTRTPS